MNYIYDILLNFHKEDYDFYDWNINDDIIHIRKIPLFKVNTNILYKIIHNDFKLPLDFMKKISNRTEIFSNKTIKIVKNMCLFTDEKDVIAVKFFNNKKDKVSRLLIDEKEEILEFASNINEVDIEIKFNREIKTNKFKTREQQKIYYFIQSEIQKKDLEKLEYTYFECFDDNEKELEKIIDKLKLAIDNNWTEYYEKIYSILKLSSMKKSKN